MTDTRESRFAARIEIRAPAALPDAIDRAAAQNLMTASEYVRRSVIDRLKADGFDLIGAERAA